MRWAVALLGVLTVQYLGWRITATLNLGTAAATAVSVTALVAELLLLASFSLQLAFSLWPSPSAPDPPASAFLPSVDVLVPSYGEPAALIARCLRGCLAMDYPDHRVWLLDDSGREELRTLCAGLGVHYLARPGREHAKAGNLNHALARCSGTLLAVFDADVVPLRHFLRQTVPLFADPATGFVQTPQSYMNADAVMRNLGLERWLMPDEECFYRWIEPSREAVGAVVCAGTSFVMRREALDRVGGFETGTPSEDLATGIRIAAAGYRNRYLPDKLSAGLAPFTAAAMVRQRCRWASGTLQVLRTGANPLHIPGLNPLQRLAYLEGILHWFNVIPQLLLVLLPLATGLLGLPPVVVSGQGLLLHALPFYGAQLLLARWLSRQSRTALLPELYRWIFLLPLAGAVLLTFAGRPQAFRVTPKAPLAKRAVGVPQALLLPLLLLLALQGLGLITLLRPAADVNLSSLSQATLGLSLSWIAVNTLLLGLAIRACIHRGGHTPLPWFALQLPCQLRRRAPGGAEPELSARLEAISEAGVELRLAAPPRTAGSLAEIPSCGAIWELRLPGLPWLPLQIQATRERQLDLAAGLRLGGLWDGLSPEQQERLEAWLYRRPDLWPQRRAPLEPLALLVVLARLIQGCPEEGWFRRSLVPQQAPDGAPAEAQRLWVL
jgi:cellulose synthase (UDP-forming)